MELMAIVGSIRLHMAQEWNSVLVKTQMRKPWKYSRFFQRNSVNYGPVEVRRDFVKAPKVSLKSLDCLSTKISFYLL